MFLFQLLLTDVHKNLEDKSRSYYTVKTKTIYCTKFRTKNKLAMMGLLQLNKI